VDCTRSGHPSAGHPQIEQNIFSLLSLSPSSFAFSIVSMTLVLQN
jgi:hypothetical protein